MNIHNEIESAIKDGKSLDTSDVTVSITPNSYVYTGSPITPTSLILSFARRKSSI